MVQHRVYKNLIALDIRKTRGLSVVFNTDVIEYGQGHNTDDNSEKVLIVDISFQKANEQKFESYTKSGVYTVVKDGGQKTTSTRKTYFFKFTPNDIMKKAWLVVRGFQENCLNDLEKDSPTCSKEAFGTVLAIIAQNGWIPHIMDVKTAFLLGEQINRKVYILVL